MAVKPAQQAQYVKYAQKDREGKDIASEFERVDEAVEDTMHLAIDRGRTFVLVEHTGATASFNTFTSPISFPSSELLDIYYNDNLTDTPRTIKISDLMVGDLVIPYGQYPTKVVVSKTIEEEHYIVSFKNVETDVVTANPTLTGTESSLTGLEVDGTKYKVKDVTANPTLAGTESSLTGLEVDGTKYKACVVTANNDPELFSPLLTAINVNSTQYINQTFSTTHRNGEDLPGLWSQAENVDIIDEMSSNNAVGQIGVMSSAYVARIEPSAFTLDPDTGSYFTTISTQHGSGLCLLLFNSGRYGPYWDITTIHNSHYTGKPLLDAQFGNITGTLDSQARVSLSDLSVTWIFNKDGDIEIMLTFYLSTKVAVLEVQLNGVNVTAAWIDHKLSTELGGNPLNLYLKYGMLESCACIDITDFIPD